MKDLLGMAHKIGIWTVDMISIKSTLIQISFGSLERIWASGNLTVLTILPTM